MIRKPNSAFTIDPVVRTMMNSTISRKLMRVKTLARTMSQVVRPDRGGRVLTSPRWTRSATSADVRPVLGVAAIVMRASLPDGPTALPDPHHPSPTPTPGSRPRISFLPPNLRGQA